MSAFIKHGLTKYDHQPSSMMTMPEITDKTGLSNYRIKRIMTMKNIKPVGIHKSSTGYLFNIDDYLTILKEIESSEELKELSRLGQLGIIGYLGQRKEEKPIKELKPAIKNLNSGNSEQLSFEVYKEIKPKIQSLNNDNSEQLLADQYKKDFLIYGMIGSGSILFIAVSMIIAYLILSKII